MRGAEVLRLRRPDDPAGRNQAWFGRRQMLALRLISASGAGKTALIARTIQALAATVPCAALLAAPVSAGDGDRIRAAGGALLALPAGPALDAGSLLAGLRQGEPPDGSMLFIEGQGDCAEDLGETAKIALLAVTDGEDRPLKKPEMFRTARLMVLTKIDLLPHVDFHAERAIALARSLNPRIEVLRLSVRSGAGFGAWLDWLADQAPSAPA